MQYDYYAFRKEQLGDSLNELEQAVTEVEQAKQRNEKNVRQRSERKIEQASEKLVQSEPHLAYLWFWAKKEESDREAQQAKRANNKAKEKEASGKAKLNSESANSIRDAWQRHLTVEKIPEAFRFTPDFSALDRLPSLSFMLRVPFKLRKPYLSKDDRPFHLLDNPVRKDKVFQTPMVASTSWKGALRSALWQSEHQENDEQIIRLFGNEREEEDHERLVSGRLYFYPTFFDKLGLEVINPHDRKTGVGKTPILIECVPKDATGEFILLYVPFGKVKRSGVAEDLELVAKGVYDMLTVYGFGAKTSSGFGIADVEGKGELAIAVDLPDLKQTELEVKPPEPELPRYLIAPGQLHPDFQSSDGSLKSEAEYLKGKSGKKENQLYDKAKKWWEREGRQLAEATTQEPVHKPEPPPKSSVTELSFDNLSELCDRAQTIAQNLSTIQ